MDADVEDGDAAQKDGDWESRKQGGEHRAAERIVILQPGGSHRGSEWAQCRDWQLGTESGWRSHPALWMRFCERWDGLLGCESLFDGGDEVRVVGLDFGGESRGEEAVFSDEELVEVPLDWAGEGGGGACERVEEGVRGGAADDDLGEERKGDVVVFGAELLDFLGIPGLLGAEVIAGESEHDEAAVLVALVEGFEAGVLAGVSALACHVDDEQHLVLEVAEGGGFSLNVFEGNAKQIGCGGCVGEGHEQGGSEERGEEGFAVHGLGKFRC